MDRLNFDWLNGGSQRDTQHKGDKMKAGDKVMIDGEEATVMHVTPAIDETCDHDWRDGADGNPEQCTKCGISFTRYIHCCP